MVIELKPQLIPLDFSGLKKYTNEQRTRLVTLNNLIAEYTVRIEKVRKAAAPTPKDMTAQERLIISNATMRQVNSEILALRRAGDGAMIETIKGLQAAASAAQEMGERHWDFFSCLRKAKTGNGDVSGLLEAMQLRSAYSEILEAAGPLELAAWAQQAIDSADAILADAVLRENFSRKPDERPFQSAIFLSKLNNTEHTQAQALLNEIIDIAQQGGLAYSQFMRRDSASFQRIQLGLKRRQSINDVDPEGAIIAEDAEEGTPEQGQL
jgi:hypothetical protein